MHLFTLLLLFATTVLSAQPPVFNITRFSDRKFENLAVRANGHILTTTAAPIAQLYLVDPRNSTPPILVTTFPNLQHATGIYELRPDIFIVAVCNITITDPSKTYPETLGVYEVDVRPLRHTPNGTITRNAAVRKVASIPQGTLLNGVTSYPGAKNFVLVADTFGGVIWRANVKTGVVDVAFRHSTLAGPGKGANMTGVNGVHVFNKQLYYTNTGAATLYKVPISKDGYVAASAQPTVVASELPGDDFILDKKGNVYVASIINAIFKVSTTGAKELLEGIPSSNSSSLIGTTAVAFGRNKSDRDSLYVTTNGGVVTVINGTQGISRIDNVKAA